MMAANWKVGNSASGSCDFPSLEKMESMFLHSDDKLRALLNIFYPLVFPFPFPFLYILLFPSPLGLCDGF